MNKKNYTLKKPIKGHTCCLTCNCGPKDVLPLNSILSVGFGEVSVKCGKKIVYSELDIFDQIKCGKLADNIKSYWTTRRAEKLAAADPNHDWRIIFEAPLYGATYQRQGKNKWVLIAKNQGFA